MLPRVGDMFLDRYVISELLGEGGNGSVFSAVDQGGQRTVAIKIIKPDGSGTYSAEVTRRFTRELRIVGQLRDPHTVRMFDHGRTPDGLLYMVFELIEGRDLAEILVDGPLPEPTALHVLSQVLESLREAHGMGLLHRDVKPENIRVFSHLDDPWTVKLLDFGIAKASDHAEPALTRTGELLGTPRYMSPEQLRDQPLTAASDLYALGLVGFEMLLGRSVLHGGRWADQFDRLMTGHLIGVGGSNHVRPQTLELLTKMTAVHPQDRPQSAAEVLRALGRPSANHVSPRATIAEPPAPPRPVGRATIVAGALLAVAALVGAAFALRALTEQPPPEVSPPPEARAVPVLPIAAPNPPSPPARDPTRSAGCGKPLNQDGKIQLSTLDGLQRVEWKAQVGRTYDPDKALPVIVLFHDDTEADDPTDFVVDARFSYIANEYGAFVLLPRAKKPQRSWRTEREVSDIEWLIEESAKQVCLDTTKIFLVGHGAGAEAVSFLACEPWVTAVATNAARPRLCGDSPRPVPHLHIDPSDTRWLPVAGGPDCDGRVAPSRDEAERAWQEQNHCEGEPAAEVVDDGTCYAWPCEAPFVSCHVPGGRLWGDGALPRGDGVDRGCDGTPVQFRSDEHIWRFFASLPATR